MEEMIMLDTNVVIDLQKGVLAEPLPKANYAVSVITEMELLSFPNLTTTELEWLQKIFTDVTVLALSEEVKVLAIAVRRHYRLKLPDAIIVATALTQNAVLLSNDQQLQSIKGLQCRALAIVDR
jgi:predicted nucleic acid-binding protein